MKKITLLLSLIMLTVINSYSQHNTYYIGHSGFGWDLIVGDMVDDLANDAGINSYGFGFQFIGGTCIANQWFNHANPGGGTDSWNELPTGNYDVVVLAEQIPILEVIDGSQWCNANIISSVEAVDNFYDMAVGANPATRMYLMEFHNEADSTSPTAHADWTALNTAMRPLWERVADSVALINSGGPNVCIVPVAAAYQALSDSIIAGVFPGISNWIDMFDSNDPPNVKIHPSEMTYYLSACVHYATIFGQSPVGLTNITFSSQGWQFDAPTPAQALIMQQIAWEVVSTDPRSCLLITDINSNTMEQPNFYPNPAEDQLFFDQAIENISIRSIDGRVILSKTGVFKELDLAGIPSGFYLLDGLSDGKKINFKFIVK